jgi:predicted metal-binding protein
MAVHQKMGRNGLGSIVMMYNEGPGAMGRPLEGTGYFQCGCGNRIGEEQCKSYIEGSKGDVVLFQSPMCTLCAGQPEMRYYPPSELRVKFTPLKHNR